MNHTRKHKVASLHSDRISATIYSSGGVTHTVEIWHYYNDEGDTNEWRKSFVGSDSANKAYDYAKQIIKEHDES